MTAATTQLRGREELIQGDVIPPIPRSLVLKLPEDFTKRRIAEMFGKFVILQHPDNIQPFDIDGLVLADRLSREFVNIVGANISNLRVLSGYLDPLFVSVVAAFKFAREATLLETKSLCRLMQWPGILKILPVARSRQSLDTDIYPDIGIDNGQGLNLGLDKHADEIAFGPVSADCDAHQFRILRQGTRPGDLKRFILFGKREVSVFVRESIRLIADRLSISTAFEAWIPGSFVEEVFERRIEILQGLLQHDAAHVVEKGSFRFFLEAGQSVRCSLIAQRLLCFSVSLRAKLKSPIPDQTRRTESLSQLLLLTKR
jgi:hypothetical protein